MKRSSSQKLGALSGPYFQDNRLKGTLKRSARYDSMVDQRLRKLFHDHAEDINFSTQYTIEGQIMSLVMWNFGFFRCIKVKVCSVGISLLRIVLFNTTARYVHAFLISVSRISGNCALRINALQKSMPFVGVCSSSKCRLSGYIHAESACF